MMNILDEAQVIQYRGVSYLVFPVEECKNPTLKAIQLMDIHDEDYDVIYQKYIDALYSDDT